MTIDEIRDQIAEWEGWTRTPDHLWIRPEWGDDHAKCVRAGLLPAHDHPIPYTLDEAAKLPEGCRGCVTIHVGLSNTVAVIVAGPLTGTRTEAPTELEARFRLRHAAMKAEMGIA